MTTAPGICLLSISFCMTVRMRWRRSADMPAEAGDALGKSANTGDKLVNVSKRKTSQGRRGNKHVMWNL
jgi:hypothetical protein